MISNKDSALILVDGSNFYYKLKDLSLEQEKFDFTKFSEWLSETKKFKVIYYVGAVRQEPKNAKSKILYAKQRSFLSQLQKQGVNVELGYIMKSDGYHEKGVDVKIATDLLVGTYENLFTKAFLVSSDTDLLPAVEKTISKGKLVEFVGFAHLPSYALIRKCSSSRLLHKEDLMKFNL
ncbi:MAG: hypothetical protein G01um101416_590 [Microgenomates group bacterium Gr01-1014_16]|nr:MAG: hypothetical protein G01um101416_590 [Microgenomates group bacterium Gr01-1014_16]